MDAAVVGVTINDEELPRAYIVLKPGAKATEKEISTWLEARVNRTKRLLGGVAFIDAVPKNPVSTFMHICQFSSSWSSTVEQ